MGLCWLSTFFASLAQFCEDFASLGDVYNLQGDGYSIVCTTWLDMCTVTFRSFPFKLWPRPRTTEVTWIPDCTKVGGCPTLKLDLWSATTEKSY